MGQDNRLSDFVLIAAYDRRDYNRYEWNDRLQRWDLSPIPLTYDTLQIIYGAGFEPDQYTEQSPLRTDDPRNLAGAYAYFVPQDWNQSDLSSPLGIHKVYPDAGLTDKSDTTDEGYQRFYEYEYIIDNLQPSQSVYAAVTAFDYGSRSYFLSALET